MSVIHCVYFCPENTDCVNNTCECSWGFYGQFCNITIEQTNPKSWLTYEIANSTMPAILLILSVFLLIDQYKRVGGANLNRAYYIFDTRKSILYVVVVESLRGFLFGVIDPGGYRRIMPGMAAAFGLHFGLCALWVMYANVLFNFMHIVYKIMSSMNKEKVASSALRKSQISPESGKNKELEEILNRKKKTLEGMKTPYIVTIIVLVITGIAGGFIFAFIPQSPFVFIVILVYLVTLILFVIGFIWTYKSAMRVFPQETKAKMALTTRMVGSTLVILIILYVVCGAMFTLFPDTPAMYMTSASMFNVVKFILVLSVEALFFDFKTWCGRSKPTESTSSNGANHVRGFRSEIKPKKMLQLESSAHSDGTEMSVITQ